jgi:hypothetical protein
MEKTVISLSEQWKRVSLTLERLQENDGKATKIERDILLHALQALYDEVLEMPTVAAETLKVGVTMPPAAAVKEAAPEGVPIPKGPAIASLDALVLATVNAYAEAHAVELPQEETVSAPQSEEQVAAVVPEHPEPTFAYVPEEDKVTFSQPSMEEVEGGKNEELFAEPDVSQPTLEEPQETIPVVEEAPSKASPIKVADSDHQAPAVQPACAAVPQQQEVQPKQPASQPKAPIQPRSSINEAVAKQPAAPKKETVGAQQKKAEPSLFDLLNQSRATDKTPSSTGKTAHTIGEVLVHPAHNVEENIEEQEKKHKDVDLRRIININDKFSFVGELFNNNMKAYNDFILHLNAIDERETAMNYVRDVAQQYKWNNESLAVKTFYTIFDRKF